ncbi:hypothetical protein ACH5RR_007094 [Cinchona calisaya]|uniref:Pentatricopeptide repeat-containing protein n=1 Tax=Cinchona calisaya TaxID=153742 RepID=A0ABD3AQT6_9GENT
MERYSDAISLLKDMCVFGVPIDEYTLTMAINCYCLIGRVNFGFPLLAVFFKRGFVPNVTTLDTILKGLFQQGRIFEAQELFKKIIYEKLCEPDEVILCKDGMVNKALALLREEIQKGACPYIVTYSSLVHGLRTLGKWKEAKKLLNETMDFNIFRNVVTYNIVIDSLCKDGLVEYAEKPTTVSYGILLNGYFKKNNLDEAMHLFKELQQRGLKPDASMYNIVMQGLFKAGKSISGRKVFSEMQTPGVKLDFDTHCMLLDGLCKNGRVDAALQLLRSMEAGGEDLYVTMYHIIPNGLCKSGRLDSARILFNSLSRKKMGKNGCLANSITYNVIVEGGVKRGKYNDAVVNLEEMDKRGFSLNASNCSILLDLIPEKEIGPSLLKIFQKPDPDSRTSNP